MDVMPFHGWWTGVLADAYWRHLINTGVIYPYGTIKFSMPYKAWRGEQLISMQWRQWVRNGSLVPRKSRSPGPAMCVVGEVSKEGRFNPTIT